MPSIYLRDYEVEDGALPENCMCCGAPATVHKDRKFAWYPSWVVIIMLLALLPGLIVALVLTKKMRVSVPLCDQHKNHWSKRTAIALIGILFPIGYILIASAGLSSDATMQLIGVNTGLVLVWLIVLVILQTMAIRPTEITAEGITLTGVSREFIEAFDALRQEERVERRLLRAQGREPEPRRSSGPDDERVQRKNDEDYV